MTTYNTINAIVGSQSLFDRVAAAAAAEGEPEPVMWASAHKWQIAGQPGWADAWQFAKDTGTINDNPDIGQRDDVINDQQILAAVQAIRSAEA